MPARSPATRCWTLVALGGAVDVTVTACDDDRLGAVLPPLAAALGLASDGLWSGSTRLGPDLPLTDPALLHGAVLGLGRPGPRSDTDARPGALELRVTGGPDAGTALPLDRGRHVVGRGGEYRQDGVEPVVVAGGQRHVEGAGRRDEGPAAGGGGACGHPSTLTARRPVDGPPADLWTPCGAVDDTVQRGGPALYRSAPIGSSPDEEEDT